MVKIIKDEDDNHRSYKSVVGLTTTIVEVNGWKGHPYRLKNIENIWSDEELKLIKKRKNMSKSKPAYKLGEEVYNDCEEQNSEVVGVFYDEEEGQNSYALKCMDNDGSIHLALESEVSEIEYIEMTVEQLKDYYECDYGCTVKIVK